MLSMNAQAEYDDSPELQQLLSDAANGETVRRPRPEPKQRPDS